MRRGLIGLAIFSLLSAQGCSKDPSLVGKWSTTLMIGLRELPCLLEFKPDGKFDASGSFKVEDTAVTLQIHGTYGYSQLTKVLSMTITEIEPVGVPPQYSELAKQGLDGVKNQERKTEATWYSENEFALVENTKTFMFTRQQR